MSDRLSNLPARRTSLFGRGRDLDSLSKLIRDGRNRLVTVAGAGGAGKTSVALEAARRLADEFPDGIWWVDLGVVGPSTDPGERAIALALLVRRALCLADGPSPVPELLVQFLSDRRVLLVLDSCEHIATEVGQFVDRMLDACPELRVLATSRSPLHVVGEAVYVLPALEVDSGNSGAEGLASLPAIQLFAERAHSARSDFELTAEVAPVVASICRRLDGLPLAIEFAAAEVAALTPVEIEALLARHHGLSESKRRVGPSRQRTMEATLDWSYDLLSDDERTLFRRLAGFGGDWTLEAAETICGEPDGSLPVSTALLTLVEHSLVVRSDGAGGGTGAAGGTAVDSSGSGGSGGSGGQTRFQFLKTVEEYAARKLDESGESEKVRLAHARYFAALAGRRERGGRHASTADIARIAAEYFNCLAGLRWAMRARIVPLSVALTLSLIEYWRVKGLLRTGLAHLEHLLTLLDDAPTRERALTLLAIADFCNLLGEVDRAAERAAEAEPICRLLGDVETTRAATGLLGDVAASRGDYEAARDWYARARLMVGDEEATPMAFWHANVGRLSLAQGRDDEARDLLETALTSFDAAEPIWYRGRVLVQLARLARKRGETERSGALLTEAFGWFKSYGARPELVECLDEMGRLALDRGDTTRAVILFGAAAGLRDSMGLPGPDSPSWPAAEIDRARNLLPAGLFAETWARGRDLSIDDIADLETAATASKAPLRSSAERAPVGSEMTPREREVAQLVALGLTNPEIAERLRISTGTTRIHIERILSKLGLTSRVQIATWIVRNDGAAGEGAADKTEKSPAAALTVWTRRPPKNVNFSD